jgi:hypothetical protein
MKTSLVVRQQAMKARSEHEKATRSALRALGRADARSAMAYGRRISERNARVCRGSKEGRHLRTKTDCNREKHREYLLLRQDFISAETLIEDQFITNIPAGDTKPTRGEPWVYYLFATLVTKHTGKRGDRSIRTRYIHTLQAETRDEVDDLLLELVTRPNVTVVGEHGESLELAA